jgi:adenine/guanine phosphoribosyltransferase-like PRPP-binding protein
MQFAAFPPSGCPRANAAVGGFQLIEITGPPSWQSKSLQKRVYLLYLSKAFEVTCSLNGERIALVDDVLTTGVTPDRIANVLLKAGASSVQVLLLARTANE